MQDGATERREAVIPRATIRAPAPTILRLAMRLAPAMRRAFLAAVSGAAGAIEIGDLEDAVRSGRVQQVLDAAQMGLLSDEALKRLRPEIGRVFAVGVANGADVAEVNPLSYGFDLRNPESLTWARQHAAALVTEVTDSTEAGLRALIDVGQREGLSVDALAREIREVVGLHSQQIAAVESFRARLADEGVEADRLARRVARYADAQLQRRAENIARTEVITASNVGQQRLWEAAGTAGDLDEKSTRRVWTATDDDRLDPLCEELDDEEAGLDEPFTSGIMHPPLHPSCWTPDHDIFAVQGWRPIATVQSGDRLWTLNPETRALEPDDIRHAWAEPFRGDLVHATSRTVDLLVTPDHAMFRVSDGGIARSPTMMRTSISDLRDGDRIPGSGRWGATRRAVPYSGPVVGVEMKQNPVVLVRRNGKAIWTGNCRCAVVLRFR